MSVESSIQLSRNVYAACFAFVQVLSEEGHHPVVEAGNNGHCTEGVILNSTRAKHIEKKKIVSCGYHHSTILPPDEHVQTDTAMQRGTTFSGVEWDTRAYTHINWSEVNMPA